MPHASNPLEIYYPNGFTQANQMYIWDGSKPVLWDGSVTFSGSLPSTVAGNKTNNAAAPTNDNLGALTAIANASAPTWTEGRQVLLSTDLSGSLRVAATISTAGLATSANQTNGSQLTGITGALPAGTNLLGRMSASAETNTIYNGINALTPKFAAINASSSGNNTLVAALTGKIRVLAYNFISNGTVNAKFQSGASGTDLTGLKYCVANMGLCAPFNPLGWFETAAATLLNLNLSAGIAVGGELVYVEV